MRVVCGGIAVCMILAVFAHDVRSEEEANFLITVRTVRAFDALEDGVPATRALRIDKRIDDLRSKLQKLRYKSYRLVSQHQGNIPLKKKDVMRLESGDIVTVRPYCFEQGKVGLWLKWVDGSGLELLDTRMHVLPGESMITGTDDESASGRILAIDVKRVPGMANGAP